MTKITQKLLTLILTLLSFVSFSQEIKMYPTNWFAGMKNQNLQIMIHGKNIQNEKVSLSKFKGVKLKSVEKTENPNYLFLNLEIKSKTAGKFDIMVGSNKSSYELKQRCAQPKAFNQGDLIYLIMPDRFANGNPANDKFDDMADPNHDRNNPFMRHGGDLEGVLSKLDYLKEIGVTAIWMTPVLENNQPLTDEGGSMRSAYHGYGITDHYNVDKRLGGNEAYKKLVDEAHKKGIKVIQDAVYNHAGINHLFLKDQPSKDWLNQWPKYTNTSYKDQPLIDPHASDSDKNITSNGWFTSFLPDLNHKNKFLANFLIQNALWSVENFGVDAWRIDTYIYNDLDFMNRCNQALLDEHPNMLIFGESWVHSAVNQSYFVKNKINFDFKCNQPSTCDFQVCFGIISALNDEFGWTSGVSKLYQTLAQDVVYEKPEDLVTFVDNHDFDRFYSVVGEDFSKFKMGMTWLLTLRGIPQVYYGTEMAVKNFKNPSDAEVRKDFPGGWTEDKINKFDASGRTDFENKAFDFFKTLANFRKNAPAIQNGSFKQFVPFDGIYVYFRIADNQTVMVISNTNKENKKVDLTRFNEVLSKFKTGTEVITNKPINDLSTIDIEAKTSFVIELK